MKTAREWFKELPDDIENMAVENVRSTVRLDVEQISLPDAIISSFNWIETPQGHDFWQNVYDQHCEE